MSEGLSASEVGKEIAEHRKHAVHGDAIDRHDRLISIIEAVLLAVVAVLAAWSGYSAAKWGTESRLELARASTARTEASRAELAALETRNFDSSTFSTWFIAYTAGDTEKMAIAERRFRPEFKVAFDAWMATNPDTNPDAPPGPTYMPEYRQPEAERATELDTSADEHFNLGEEDGTTADKYVRTTVFLATVLFLVGISGHFRVRAARYGLVTVGVIMLTVAVAQLIALPKPMF
jgi:hypothetical protein